MNTEQIPDDEKREIHAAMDKMAARLVESRHAIFHIEHSKQGKGTFALTDDGIRLRQSLITIFGDGTNQPSILNGVEIIALVHFLFLPEFKK